MKLQPLIAQRAKVNQSKGGAKSLGGGKVVRQKSDKPVDTKREVAEIAGVSHDTIAKVQAILREAACRLARVSGLFRHRIQKEGSHRTLRGRLGQGGFPSFGRLRRHQGPIARNGGPFPQGKESLLAGRAGQGPVRAFSGFEPPPKLLCPINTK